MTQHNDMIRLRHMLDHAEEAVALVAGKDKTELKHDRVLELALIRLVEIIGLWGRAKLTIRNLIKKFGKDGLFWAYIAIFMIKNRIIDGLLALLGCSNIALATGRNVHVQIYTRRTFERIYLESAWSFSESIT